jgi:hypothetical protein
MTEHSDSSGYSATILAPVGGLGALRLLPRGIARRVSLRQLASTGPRRCSLALTMNAPESALWRPSPEAVKASAVERFRHHVNSRYGLQLTSYEELYRWSCDHTDHFWAECCALPRKAVVRVSLTGPAGHFCGVVASKPFETVVDLSIPMDRAPPFFPEARLNWAENMLQERSPDKIALISCSASHLKRRHSCVDVARSRARGQGYLTHLPPPVVRPALRCRATHGICAETTRRRTSRSCSVLWPKLPGSHHRMSRNIESGRDLVINGRRLWERGCPRSLCPGASSRP